MHLYSTSPSPQITNMDTYGGFSLTSNGRSHMDFAMRLYRTQILSSKVNSRDPIGVYEVGSPVGEFTELDQEAFNKFKAVTVYRIVTLEVSILGLPGNGLGGRIGRRGQSTKRELMAVKELPRSFIHLSLGRTEVKNRTD